MPTIRINIKVKQRGPIFNAAESKAAAKRMIIRANDAVAQEGVNRIKAQLHRVLQNPTGYYESKIVTDRRTIYRGITDSNVVYGGWLEGVTDRNRATRFKGYFTFRMIKQELDRDSVEIAQPHIDAYIREMNR